MLFSWRRRRLQLCRSQAAFRTRSSAWSSRRRWRRRRSWPLTYELTFFVQSLTHVFSRSFWRKSNCWRPRRLPWRRRSRRLQRPLQLQRPYALQSCSGVLFMLFLYSPADVAVSCDCSLPSCRVCAQAAPSGDEPIWPVTPANQDPSKPVQVSRMQLEVSLFCYLSPPALSLSSFARSCSLHVFLSCFGIVGLSQPMSITAAVGRGGARQAAGTP